MQEKVKTRKLFRSIEIEIDSLSTQNTEFHNKCQSII